MYKKISDSFKLFSRIWKSSKKIEVFFQTCYSICGNYFHVNALNLFIFMGRSAKCFKEFVIITRIISYFNTMSVITICDFEICKLYIHICLLRINKIRLNYLTIINYAFTIISVRNLLRLICN